MWMDDFTATFTTLFFITILRSVVDYDWCGMKTKRSEICLLQEDNLKSTKNLKENSVILLN